LQFVLKDIPQSSRPDDLYRSRLEAIIDPTHELVKMSRPVGWNDLAGDLKAYPVVHDTPSF